MLASLKKWFAPSPLRLRAQDLYLVLVRQARRPVFYADWKVPDTVDGRFDVIVFHLWLVLQRLGDAGMHAELVEFSRDLQECFFADMDRSLREMGVSDTGVGKRMKKMAEAFYGRQQSYTHAIYDNTLCEAIMRNVYRNAEIDDVSLQAIEAYILRNKAHLHGLEASALLSAPSSLFIE